jgi:hypothetical protein
MSERALQQLVGALAIASGVWFVASVLSGGSGSIGASAKISGFFDEIDDQSVSSLTMEIGTATVELSHEAGTWTVNGFRADPATIARLTATFPNLEIGDLTASNPDNHERMGVSGEHAVTVTFGFGGEQRTLIVGDNGRSFGTSFVRLPGADEVYLLRGDLGANARRDESSWRDRTMATNDSASIHRIVVERTEGAYTLVRGDSAWTIDGSTVAAVRTITGVLGELSNLVATGFLAETDSIARLGSASVTRAFGENGQMLAEITVGSGEADRWARTSSDDYLYRISSFRAGRIAPTHLDLIGG